MLTLFENRTTSQYVGSVRSTLDTGEPSLTPLTITLPSPIWATRRAGAAVTSVYSAMRNRPTPVGTYTWNAPRLATAPTLTRYANAKPAVSAVVVENVSGQPQVCSTVLSIAVSATVAGVGAPPPLIVTVPVSDSALGSVGRL